MNKPKIHLFSSKSDNKMDGGKILANGLQIILLIVLLIQPITFTVQYASFPFPFEYRDAASISIAMDFANSNNPYTAENFPSHMYVYGILYPALIFPFVHIVNHPIIIARIIDLIFLILSLFIAALIMKRFSAKTIPILLALGIFLNSICLIWKINGARPDTMGLFFSFLSIFLVLSKRDHLLNIILSAVASVLCFYTKQYFFYIFIVIFSFLFFYRSKRHAMVYALAGGLFLILSLLAMNHFFPLYINYTILHHINLAGNDLLRMGNETKTFISYYWILFIIYFVVMVISLNAEIPLKDIKNNIKKGIASIFSDQTYSIFHIGMIVSLILLTFIMGKHNGNTYTYYGELLLPFLVFGALSRIEKISKNTFLIASIQICIMLFCMLPFSKNYSVDIPSRAASFEQLYDIAQKCENIYENTPLLTLYKLDHQIAPVYNNGQSEYALSAIPEENSIFEKITQIPPEVLRTKYLEYEADVSQNINAITYNCLFLDQETVVDGYAEYARFENMYYWTVYVLQPEKKQ